MQTCSAFHIHSEICKETILGHSHCGLSYHICRNPSLGLATKANGLQGCGPRGSPGVKARESSGVKAKRPQGCGPRRSSRQKKARESHHILSGVLGSVRECEGVNPHTPKATPILGGGVPEDS